MIRVAVAGARGRMGRLVIDNVLKADDMELVLALDVVGVGESVCDGVEVSDGARVFDVLPGAGADVLIDFTRADAAMENVAAAAHSGVAVVVGTTGFTDEQKEQLERVVEGRVPCILSPNFSIGVNAFFRIVEAAARLLSAYDVEIVEAHHRGKRDAPSGTAKRLAEIVSEVFGGRKFVYGREGISPREDEIGVHAVRGGDIVGEHTVLFAGDGDRIELTHRAHSRSIFAAGAVEAARWIVSQPPRMHTMDEFLSSLVS